jgi:drug/metabolite transporter (DMT)-like permease
MNLCVFALIILTVILNTYAQIALKAGMMQIGVFSFTWENLLPITIKVITSTWIISGIAVYAASVFTWLMVLSRAPVSIAYPMSSLGYIATAIAAYYIWSEDLTPMRIAGIIVILIGVYLVAKN